jgi:hypothetical protein
VASDEGGRLGDELPGTAAGTPKVTGEQGHPETSSDAGALSEAENQRSLVNALLPGTEEAKRLEDRLNGTDQPGPGQPPAPGGDLASASPAKTPAADPAPAPDGDGRNLWDFLSVAVVIVSLVGLTVFLVERNSLKPSDVEAILGIVVPVFAAVFGATLGYATGHVTGKSSGKKAAKAYVMPRISRIQAARSQPGSGIRTARAVGLAADGAQMFAFAPGSARAPLDAAGDADIDSQLGEIKGYLEGL